MHSIAALGFEIDRCHDHIVYERIVERLRDIDIEFAQAVAEKTGAPTPQKQGRPNHDKKIAGLSIIEFNALKPTIASRSVAMLIGDGYDPMAFNNVHEALKAAMAFPCVISRSARRYALMTRARAAKVLSMIITSKECAQQCLFPFSF